MGEVTPLMSGMAEEQPEDAASLDYALRLADALDRDEAGLAVDIDPTEDPEGRRHLFKVMNLIDGTRSIEQIAATSAAPVDAVQRIVGLLQQHGLVAL